MQALSPVDYGQLPERVSGELQLRAIHIKSLIGNIKRDTIEIGLHLQEAKALVPHGQFGAWLQQEFQWSQDTAENFMKVAQLAQDNPKISELSDQFGRSALYLMASPSTPPEVVEEAVSRAEQGQKVTHGQVKELIAQRRPPSQSMFEPVRAPAPPAARPEPRPAAPPAQEENIRICTCGEHAARQAGGAWRCDVDAAVMEPRNEYDRVLAGIYELMKITDQRSIVLMSMIVGNFDSNVIGFTQAKDQDDVARLAMRVMPRRLSASLARAFTDIFYTNGSEIEKEAIRKLIGLS